MSRFFPLRRFRPAVVLATVLILVSFAEATAAAPVKTGATIYRQHCVQCHGDNGQGVSKVNTKAFKAGKTLAELTKLIDETMPEEKPELCRGDDAKLVAKYIADTFIAANSRSQNQPARIELARLTVHQYLNTAADLLNTSNGIATLGNEQGLSAQYFRTRRFANQDRAFTRTDPQVAFAFGAKSPDPKIAKPEEFSIRWEGSILAEDTGDYEFTVRADIGARLWVNDYGKMFIDAWTSSNGPPQEHTETIRLIGGRVYPIRLDVFKYKQPKATIELLWKPPHKAKEIIPARVLSTRRVGTTFVVKTAFPPDDKVSGYERGTAISKAWDQATTQAAVEIAGEMFRRLNPPGDFRRGKRGGRGSQGNSGDPKSRAMQSCVQLAERAFRRPLTEPQRKFFVDSQFAAAPNVESGLKRSVLLILKSPRFLYPGVATEAFDDYDAATNLALALWDSLPDDELLRAASRKEFRTAEQIEKQATRMLADPRAKSKLRRTMHEWLQMDEKEGINKDKKLFPDFDERIATDMRTSLDLQLDDVIWSERSDYRELLLADSVFVNDRLAKFYGLNEPPKSGFEKVKLDPGKRAGVLTHPYLLSTFAYHNLSSPIHRGVFVTRRLLGRTLKPPPQATEFKDANFDPHMTTREKVTLITKPVACQTCHTIINPLGFSLEQFDAVGRYREKEKDRPVDVTSVFTTVTGENVKLDGARRLAEMIAGSEQAHGAFVDHLFHQAVKQPINAYGDKTRPDLIRSFRQNGFHIRKLLVEIAKTSILYERQKSEILSTKSEKR